MILINWINCVCRWTVGLLRAIKMGYECNILCYFKLTLSRIIPLLWFLAFINLNQSRFIEGSFLLLFKQLLKEKGKPRKKYNY